MESVTLTAGTTEPTASLAIAGAPALSGQPSAPIVLAVGQTTIPVQITAEDGSVRSYTITVTRAGPPLSSDATLASLVPSQGSLSPAFDPDVDGYAVTVANAVIEIAFVPVAADPAAIVAVAGQAVTSGNSSAPVALAVGATTIPITVTAADGTTRNYTVSVTRSDPPLSTDASLLSLVPSEGSVSPAFDPDIQTYVLQVEHEVDVLTLTAETAHVDASLLIAGVAATSGQPSTPVSLGIGTTDVAIRVTAQDGTIRTYEVAVVRADPPLSSNARLAALATSEGILAPLFDPMIDAYALAVDHAVETVTLTAVTAHPAATVDVAGAPSSSGQASAPVSVPVGTTTVPIRVTAEDGGTRTYTVAVTRAPSALSSEAGLASLVPSEGLLSPAFDTAIGSYSLSVDHDVESVSFTSVTLHPGATIAVAAQHVVSGIASAPISLASSTTTVPIRVTAEDGTERPYTITVTRAAPPPAGSADLARLVPSAGSLAPEFDPVIDSYRLTVGHDVSAIAFVPETADPAATILVDGRPVASGSSSAPVTLAVGTTTVPIRVTAEDGGTRTYTIDVERAGPPQAGNADLALLETSPGPLTPAFDPHIDRYDLTVGHETDRMTLTAAAVDPSASVTVSGIPAPSDQPFGPIPLAVGTTIVPIDVIAEDGTARTYTLHILRSEPAASSDAALGSLVPSDGTLSPAFDPEIDNYTMTIDAGVETITFAATTSHPGATVAVDGHDVASGAQSRSIRVGRDGRTSVIVVTAEDGVSSRRYTVGIRRAELVSTVVRVEADASIYAVGDWMGLTIRVAPASASGRVEILLGEVTLASSELIDGRTIWGMRLDASARAARLRVRYLGDASHAASTAEMVIPMRSAATEFERHRAELAELAEQSIVSHARSGLDATRNLLKGARGRMILRRNAGGASTAPPASATLSSTLHGHFSLNARGRDSETTHGGAEMDGAVSRVRWLDGRTRHIIDLAASATRSDGLTFGDVGMRFAVERDLSDDLTLGAFVGLQAGRGRINRRLLGEETHLGVDIGAFGVMALSDTLFFEGSLSRGFSATDLDLWSEDAEFAGSFTSRTDQAVVGLTGIIGFPALEIHPSASLEWSRTRSGSAQFDVSVDEDRAPFGLDVATVSILRLSVSPELHFPLTLPFGSGGAYATSVGTIEPTLVCERVIGLVTRQDCGPGLGIGFTTSDIWPGSNFRASVRTVRIGSDTRTSAYLQFSLKF